MREQLVAQITLGIASGDLTVGERLPSTRELARRFHIHQNTVSSVYRELAARGLAEFKKGSGVFVAKMRESLNEPPKIDKLFARFLDEAERQGYSRDDVYSFVRDVLASKPPKRFLVVESDAAFRDIIIEEIQRETGVPTEGTALQDFSPQSVRDDVLILAMFDEEPRLAKILPSGESCMFLNPNSVPRTMSNEPRPSEKDLIAIVSGWDRFVSFAKLFLLAAKIEPEMFITRSTKTRNWKKGLNQAAIIICDSLTANQFSNDPRVRVFSLIASSSLAQLRNTIGARE